MKHIVENFDESIVASALWDFYFKDLQVGVFDIETTGLDRDRNKFVLGGLYNCSTKKLHQILAQSRKEEKAALDFQEILKNVKERDYIDSHREVAPLRQAEDALVLDNSDMTREEQSAWLLAKYKEIVS